MSKLDAPAEADEGADFRGILGRFGSHAEPAKRAHAERLAGMGPTDKRRRRAKPARPHQFNVRVSDATKAQADALCTKHSWSQADLVEQAVAALHAKLAGGA